MATERTRNAWKLVELADEAGVSARTVRYYVQRGLLPAPPFRGPDTVYGPDHLLRLMAIKRLQEAYLPLDAIQVELARRSPEEIRELALSPDPLPRDSLLHPPPAPAAAPAIATDELPERWERHHLIPGVELHVSDRADRRARELVDRLRRELKEER
jgi:Ca-activated chloride channel family protein